MFGLGGFEIAIIAIFGFLIFGPDKLPQIARTVGRGIRQFRSAQDQMNKVIKSEVYDPIKDMEPLVNPFAGFSLDPTKDEKTPASKAKGAKPGADKNPIKGTDSDVKKISSDAMKAAISQESAKAKEKAVAEKTEAGKESGSEGDKEKASAAKKAEPAEKSAPSESFAQRRARLEMEHAKAKAAKTQSETAATASGSALQKDTEKSAKTSPSKESPDAFEASSTEKSTKTTTVDARKEDKEGK